MLNLLYKEFNLSIHKFYLFFPLLTAALLLIPQWPFFIALMYFFFVSVPNLTASYNAQLDNEFSIILPVGKTDIVKARITAFVILELIHILTAVVFAVLNIVIYRHDNFMLNLGPAFFGIAFVMFGLFNIVFFPLYYKTAYNYGLPLIFGITSVVFFIGAVELSVIFIPSVAALLEGTAPSQRLAQLIILFAGIAVFMLMNAVTFRLSAARFEKVDI